MTELYEYKPIVKLPKKRQSMVTMTANHRNATAAMALHPQTYPFSATGTDFLVSEMLYLDTVPPSVSESDVKDMVSSCAPVDVHIDRNTGHGYIRFQSKQLSDRAYTLFNGAALGKHDARLQLRIFPPGDTKEPEAASGILHVKNLPGYTTNSMLYDLFRPFGPMSLCKIIVEQGSTFKGTALVQYFRSEDADKAVTMNNRIIGGNLINVFPFVSKRMRPQSGDLTGSTTQAVAAAQPGQQHETKNGSTVSVDYSNLYIKNLDLNVKSSDLFNHFRAFGRIISARVMKNPQTKQSKGFGFVSFSRTDEAFQALREMNGKYIMSKPIVVAFHEPKKPRSDKSSSPPTVLHNSFNPSAAVFTPAHTARYSMPHQHPAPPHHHHPSFVGSEFVPSTVPLTTPLYPMTRSLSVQNPRVINNGLHAAFNGPDKMTAYHNPKQNGNNNSNHYMQRKASRQSMVVNGNVVPAANSVPPPSYTTTPWLSAKTTAINENTKSNNIVNNNEHYQYKMTPQGRPTLRRRTSEESVPSAITETSSSIQKQRMMAAIIKSGEKDNVDDITDMLLTLKRKERSLCLFNPDFLRAKIQLAKSALELFMEEEEDEQRTKRNNLSANSTAGASKQQQQQQLQQQLQQQQYIGKTPSRAIPIVPPPPAAQQAASKGGSSKVEKVSSNGNSNAEQQQETMIPANDINKFLQSLEGLAVHEKKQKLGNLLFPLVKATGFKGAPKITIRLLDTIPLHELAHFMYDKQVLTSKVQVVAAKIQQEKEQQQQQQEQQK